MADLSLEFPCLLAPRNQGAGPGWSKGVEGGMEKPAEKSRLLYGLLAISWNMGLFCKHSKLGQLCEVWPWLGRPSSLSKQQEIFFLFLSQLNLLWVHNLYSSSELQFGFLPKKEKHLRFSTHPPHPAGRMPRLPSKARAGRLLLWGRAGMCCCCRGRRHGPLGVAAVVVQAGVLYRSERRG